MVNWLRVAIGLAIVSLGITVFIGMPLPANARTTYDFAQLAISVGGIAALAGIGVVMSAFLEH